MSSSRQQTPSSWATFKQKNGLDHPTTRITPLEHRHRPAAAPGHVNSRETNIPPGPVRFYNPALQHAPIPLYYTPIIPPIYIEIEQAYQPETTPPTQSPEYLTLLAQQQALQEEIQNIHTLYLHNSTKLVQELARKNQLLNELSKNTNELKKTLDKQAQELQSLRQEVATINKNSQNTKRKLATIDSKLQQPKKKARKSATLATDQRLKPNTLHEALSTPESITPDYLTFFQPFDCPDEHLPEPNILQTDYFNS